MYFVGGKFLADRTNVALILCNVASVRHLSVVCDVCIVAKRCVLEQKLLLTEESIDTKMNDLDLCEEVV